LPEQPSSNEGRLAGLLEAVRSQGARLTTARRALLGALVAGRGHLSADDLAAAVQAEHPDIHRSTVYRTLDALEQIGVIDHVHLGHGRAVYHLIDDPHQHLVCEECGLVIEVPDSMFDALAGDLASGYGFVLRPHHFAALGKCASCAARDSRTSPDSREAPRRAHGGHA
jgi:Fur family transcriptional regulator, ferric uptake regulator